MFLQLCKRWNNWWQWWKLRCSNKRWRLFEVQKNLELIHYEKYGWLSPLLFEKNVLLLAEVFEKFFDTCLKCYKLDTCRYFSSPGLSWDSMLKMTGVKEEKNSDVNMYLFI